VDGADRHRGIGLKLACGSNMREARARVTLGRDVISARDDRTEFELE
jgi:hypothetical protein